MDLWNAAGHIDFYQPNRRYKLRTPKVGPPLCQPEPHIVGAHH